MLVAVAHALLSNRSPLPVQAAFPNQHHSPRELVTHHEVLLAGDNAHATVCAAYILNRVVTCLDGRASTSSIRDSLVARQSAAASHL